MTDDRRQNFRLPSSVFCLLFSIFFSITGCAQHNYKVEADEKVYEIIDRKWQQEFGSKANYKISDVPASPNDIQISKDIPAGSVLSLAQAVALATAHNRDYQLQKETLYTSALDLRLTRHQFETQFFGGLSGGYDADWNDEVWGLEANLGFNRLLKAGTQAGIRVSAAWLDVLTGNMKGGLASILTATVSQPLLRGSDPKVVLEDLTQAERDTLYQIRSFNHFRKTFVVSIITQYYQILKLYELARNEEANYDALTAVFGRVEKLTRAGRLPVYELDNAQQEMLKARDIHVQAEKDYESQLDLFKITLGVPATAEFRLDEGVLQSLKTAGVHDPNFNENEAIETALYRRLDLANSADAVIDAQRKVYVAADALRADLNITGSTNVATQGKGSRQTLHAVKDYNLDIELDLPLDRVAEQNIYRKALITLNRQQREYELASDTVKLEIRQAYRDLAEASQRYKLQCEAVAVAQEHFRKTSLLMQYGRAGSRRILDAQRDLFEARNEAAKSLVNYAIATLNFYRDTGVLQVRPDGMWEKGSDSVPASDRAAAKVEIPLSKTN
ncbi:MAG: TolC family protein [Sedimentisphaerales bacterium]|nr:TolC family protein [Sedimentisphaerales bacterium]